jgi:serine-type D-Ala-D-Ala carboxypeptidase (penicillin-binding protein 5/6)
MNSSDLQKLAEHARSTREAGITLLFASIVLGFFLFIPLTNNAPEIKLENPEIQTPGAFRTVLLEAKAAIVYDLVTKKILYAKNADAQLPLASLTKLLTAYAALQELPLGTLITISKRATEIEDAYAFSVGDTLSLHDLARLTLTGSLNDGAGAIAEAVVTHKSVSETTLLAGVASSLNLDQTYAVNGSGLDVSTAISGGYGSAIDIARLAGALADKAYVVTEATTQPIAIAVSKEGKKFSIKNTDPIVSYIPGLLLSKTGYTELAEGNLALVFDVGVGHPIAVVVLGSTLQGRFTDGTTLVTATFDHFSETSL